MPDPVVYTFNRFRDTRIYGSLKNSDNGSNLASASFDRTLQVGTDLTVGGNATISGNETVIGSLTCGSLSVNGASVVIGDYLKSADAQTTYQPISSMSQYYTKTSIDTSLTALSSSLTSAISSNSSGDRTYADNSVATLKTSVDASILNLNTALSSGLSANSVSDNLYTDTAVGALKVNYIDPSLSTITARVDSNYNTLNTALTNYITSANMASGTYASLNGDLNLTHKLTVADDVTCSKDLNVTGNFFLGGQLIQSSLSSLSDQIQTVSSAVSSVDLSNVPKLDAVNNFSGIVNGFQKITLQTPPVLTYANLPSPLQSNQIGYTVSVSNTTDVALTTAQVKNLCSITLEAGYYIITFTMQSKINNVAAKIDSSFFGLCSSATSMGTPTNGCLPDGISQLGLMNVVNGPFAGLRNTGTWVGAFNNFNSNGTIYLNIQSFFSATSHTVGFANINCMRIA